MARPPSDSSRPAIRPPGRILVRREYSRSLVRPTIGKPSRRARRVHGGVDTDAFSPGDGCDAARRASASAGATLVFTVRVWFHAWGSRSSRPLRRLTAPGRRPRDRRHRAARGRLAAIDPLDSARGRSPRARHRRRARRLVSRRRPLRDALRRVRGVRLVTARRSRADPGRGHAVGATPELLAPLDRALLADGIDPASIARGVERALDGADSLRDRCRTYAVERLSWGKVMPAWESAICGAVRVS